MHILNSKIEGPITLVQKWKELQRCFLCKGLKLITRSSDQDISCVLEKFWICNECIRSRNKLV
jgi:hypothetical protein